jgi:hypothetical protein
MQTYLAARGERVRVRESSSAPLTRNFRWTRKLHASPHYVGRGDFEN